jgi:hypothetical protein
MQHAPGGGQGLIGAHPAAVVWKYPVGQTWALNTWHWPVVSEQQVTCGGGHGLTGVHVDPMPAKMPGAGQAEAAKTMLQV